MYEETQHTQHGTTQDNKNKITKKLQQRNTRESYSNILRDKNWEWVNTLTDLNGAWTTFKTLITEAMDEVAPEKEIRLKNRTGGRCRNDAR